MNESENSARGKIFYIYDALCGWCYGFSPVIKKIYEAYRQQFDFDILSGGMVMEERAGIVKPEMAEYIIQSIPRVENLSGIQFGKKHIAQLEQASLYQSSLKPAIAMCVFKKHLPAAAFSFAADMQSAYFYDGKNLEDDNTYVDLIAAYGVDAGRFLEQLESDEYKYRAHLEFDYVQDLGVTGFPALIGIKNSEYFWISQGFQTYENMHQLLEQFSRA